MLDAYRPIALLAALWPTPEFEFPPDPAQLAERMRGQFGVFNEQRLVKPAVGVLPPELPQLVLLGDQRRCIMELAPGKISLRRMVQGQQTLDEIYAGHGDLLRQLVPWMAENLNLRICRLGVATTLFCPLRSSANEKINNYFLQPRVFKGQVPHDMNLSIMTRLPLAGDMLANCWLRIRPLRSADARRLDFAAQFEVDINTLIEDTAVKTMRDIDRFLQAARDYVANDIPILQDADFLA